MATKKSAGKVSSKVKGANPETAAKKATKKAVAAQKAPSVANERQFKKSGIPSFRPEDLLAKSGISGESFAQLASAMKADTHGAKMALAEKLGSQIHKQNNPAAPGAYKGGVGSRQMAEWSKSNPNREYQAARSYRKAGKARREGTTGVSPTKTYGPYQDKSDWLADRPRGGGRGVAAPRKEWVAWGTSKPGFEKESYLRAQGKNPYGDQDDSKKAPTK